MNKVLTGFSLVLLLASCGMAPAPAPTTATSTVVQAREIPKPDYTAEDVAKEFMAAGVSDERLSQMQRDLALSEQLIREQQAGQLSAQSQDNLSAEIDILTQGMELAMGRQEKQGLDASAYARATLINATRNISHNSLNNFLYHQNAASYAPVLTYDDDKCSTPFGVFPTANNLFAPACDQHDFGYRNGAFWDETHNSAFKGAVDAAFNTNMMTLCQQRWNHSPNDLKSCNNQAATFFYGVKAIPVCWPVNGPLCWKDNLKYGEWF